MSAETISRSSVCLDSPLKVGAKDQLNMEEYHQSLIKFIEDARDDDTPITIALQGEWGSGKTSIMNILKAELCEGENAKFYSVNINAWKFCMLDSTSKSAPSQAVVNILQSMIYQIMAFKPNNMQRERVDLILNKIAAAMSNAKSIYDVIGEPLLSQAGVNKTVVGFVGKAINTLKSAGSKEEKKSTDNISLVEQLHKEVEDIVEDILSTKYNQKQEQKHVLPHKDRDNQKNNTDQSYLQKKPISLINIKSVPYVISFRICVFLVNILFYVLDLAILIACQMFMFLVEFTSNFLLLLWRIFYYLLSIVFDFCIYIKEQLCSIGTECNPQKTSKYKKESTTDSNNTNNKRGFIFFIDDLDRIQPELALEILEILKNLFDIKHCIFIIAIDPVVLNEAITKKLGVLTFNDLYKFQCYLNKLIQITFPAPIAFYDIIPMLKNELIKISYFNEDDLKSQDLLEFLKSAIKESINNNPRLFKTIVNKLSLANILNNKLNERKGSESVFGLFEKKLTFVLICIVVGFPDVFAVISRFPYLRGWNDELAKACYLGPADNNLLLQLKLLKGIDLKGQNQHASWEFILFRMCQYNDCKNGFDNFEKVLKLLRLIDQMCFDEVDGNLDEYKNLMIKFFKLAKGHPLSDDLS